MLRATIAILALNALLASASFAQDAETSDAIAELPESIKAEMRWIRAERDRANAALARDFIEKGEHSQRKQHGSSQLGDNSPPAK
jgi:hypothetical protein